MKIEDAAEGRLGHPFQLHLFPSRPDLLGMATVDFCNDEYSLHSVSQTSFEGEAFD